MKFFLFGCLLPLTLGACSSTARQGQPCLEALKGWLRGYQQASITAVQDKAGIREVTGTYRYEAAGEERTGVFTCQMADEQVSGFKTVDDL